MRHAIDPKIDCVFKALLGSEENRNLLIHFLNAFLAPDLIEPFGYWQKRNSSLRRTLFWCSFPRQSCRGPVVDKVHNDNSWIS